MIKIKCLPCRLFLESDFEWTDAYESTVKYIYSNIHSTFKTTVNLL